MTTTQPRASRQRRLPPSARARLDVELPADVYERLRTHAFHSRQSLGLTATEALTIGLSVLAADEPETATATYYRVLWQETLIALARTKEQMAEIEAQVARFKAAMSREER